MRDWVDALLSPAGWALLAGLGLVLPAVRRRRLLRRAAGAALFAAWLFATPLGAGALVALQERRVAMQPACEVAPEAIVLLAAGRRRALSGDDDVAALGEASVQRSLGAARLQQETGLPLVITGGEHWGEPVSAGMASLLRRLGVPDDAIRLERQSRSTLENARLVAAMQPPVPRPVWLVTSAVHMPRSLVAFRAAGFEPCAWAVDRRAGARFSMASLLPRGGAIARSEAVLHEWVGELVYRWRLRGR